MNVLLIQLLIDPGKAVKLDLPQYGQLIRQARSANLLASLAQRFHHQNLSDAIPYQVRRHLDSALLVHSKQKSDLAYNIKLLQRGLAEVDQKLVLLKGAAYLQADIAAAQGRLLSDIDIIVPRDSIDATEQAMCRHGWESGGIDPYNERYYRQWMHEIPPMRHARHGSTLDLHFTILPPTAAANIDASLLFEKLQEVRKNVYTLCPQDMVIHSATHLFHEGEFHNGLRDLWDLDRMLREFSSNDETFWQTLVGRAEQLDLVGPLYYGLSYSRRIFATPVPDTVLTQASSWSRKLRKPIMDFLFLRAFRPDQPECRLPLTGLALYLLFLRSHYLRMPVYLLLPHLVRKAWMSRFGEQPDPGLEPEKP